MPASNYPTQLRDIARDLLRTNKSTLDIKYWNGNRKIIYANRDILSVFFFQIMRCDKKSILVLNYSILKLLIYIQALIKNEYLPKIMAKAAKHKGIDYRLRCYPSEYIVLTLSMYLLPEEKSFAKVSRTVAFLRQDCLPWMRL